MPATKETLEIVAVLKNEVTGELGKLQDSINNLEGKSEEAFDRATAGVRNFRVGVSATTAVVSGLVAALGARQFFEFGKGLSDAAASAQELRSAYEVVFSGLTEDVDAFAQTLSVDVGRGIGDISAGLVGFQDIFVPLGLAREDAAELSKVLVALGIDLASFRDTSDSEAFSRLQSGLVGNVEVLRRYGVALNQAIIEQRAIELGLIKTKNQIDPTSKALAILSLTLEGSGDALGDAARTSGSFSNQMKALRSQLKDVRAELGQGLNREILQLLDSLGGVESVVAAVSVAFSGLSGVATGLIQFLRTDGVPVLFNLLTTAEGVLGVLGQDAAADAITRLLELPALRAQKSIVALRELRESLEKLEAQASKQAPAVFRGGLFETGNSTLKQIEETRKQIALLEQEVTSASNALGESFRIDPQTLNIDFINVSAERLKAVAAEIAEIQQQASNVGLSLSEIPAEQAALALDVPALAARFELVGKGLGEAYVGALSDAAANGGTLADALASVEGAAKSGGESNEAYAESLEKVVGGLGGSSEALGQYKSLIELTTAAQSEFTLSIAEQRDALAAQRDQQLAAIEVFRLQGASLKDVEAAISAVNRAYADQSGGLKGFAADVDEASSALDKGFQQGLTSGVSQGFNALGASIDSSSSSLENFVKQLAIAVAEALAAQAILSAFGINGPAAAPEGRVGGSGPPLDSGLNLGGGGLDLPTSVAGFGFSGSGTGSGSGGNDLGDIADQLTDILGGGGGGDTSFASTGSGGGLGGRVFPSVGSLERSSRVTGGVHPTRGGTQPTLVVNIYNDIRALDGADARRVLVENADALAEISMDAYQNNASYRAMFKGDGAQF